MAQSAIQAMSAQSFSDGKVQALQLWCQTAPICYLTPHDFGQIVNHFSFTDAKIKAVNVLSQLGISGILS